VRAGALRSAHDVSEGGLACCVAESAIAAGVGVTLDLEPLVRRADVDARTALFGEGPGGVVVSGPRDALLELSGKAAAVGFLALGEVGGGHIRISASTARLDLSVDDAGRIFDGALADRVS
jgi:phosphoribosylformylglycinamidine synthase